MSWPAEQLRSAGRHRRRREHLASHFGGTSVSALSDAGRRRGERASVRCQVAEACHAGRGLAQLVQVSSIHATLGDPLPHSINGYALSPNGRPTNLTAAVWHVAGRIGAHGGAPVATVLGAGEAFRRHQPFPVPRCWTARERGEGIDLLRFSRDARRNFIHVARRGGEVHGKVSCEQRVDRNRYACASLSNARCGLPRYRSRRRCTPSAALRSAVSSDAGPTRTYPRQRCCG
jgi:hypothetical protein